MQVSEIIDKVTLKSPSALPVSTKRLSRKAVPVGVASSLPTAMWQLAAQVERRIGWIVVSNTVSLKPLTERTPPAGSNGSL